MPKLADWGKDVVNKGGGTGGGRYIDNKAWKKDGQIVFWIHPDTMFADRVTVRLPVAVTDDEGKKRIYWVRRKHRGDQDAAAKFLEWLGGQEDIDADDVVLRCKNGKEKEEYTKGDLLGLKGYDWKRKLLNPRTETLVTVVPKEAPENGILALPISAGKKLWRQIESQMSDVGEDGNPQLNPYPLKVTFDESARAASDYYDAAICRFKLTDEVRACFDQPPFDVEGEADGPDDDNHGSTAELLAKLCVVDCPLLNDGETVETTTAKAKTKAKPKKAEAKKAPKKAKPAPEPEPEDEDDEDEDDSSILVKDCEKGETYKDADGNILTFIHERQKGGHFETEDGERVKLRLNDTVWPVDDEDVEDVEDVDVADTDEDEDEGEEDAADTVLVSDAVEGEWYFDSDGDLVQFVEYDDDNEVGLVTDEEGDSYNLDGDDVLTPKKKH